MATLNLFPARIPFVDDTGRLTPEAYRALQGVFARLGGSFGDQGSDVFADVVGSFVSDNVFVNGEQVSADYDPQFFSEIERQPVDVLLEPIMVFAEETTGAPIQSVTAGASPYVYAATQNGTLSIGLGTVSLVSFDRGGTSLTVGFTSGLIPMATGDKVTVTYTVAPTLNFIPR